MKKKNMKLMNKIFAFVNQEKKTIFMCQQQQHLLVNHTDKTTSHNNFFFFYSFALLYTPDGKKIKIVWKNCSPRNQLIRAKEGRRESEGEQVRLFLTD